jgi:hypothetical protein
LGQAEGLVGIDAADRHRMILVSRIWASGFRALREIGQQAGSFLVDDGIALDRRGFAASAGYRLEPPSEEFTSEMTIPLRLGTVGGLWVIRFRYSTPLRNG